MNTLPAKSPRVTCNSPMMLPTPDCCARSVEGARRNEKRQASVRMRRAQSMALLQQESKGLFHSLETSPYRYRGLKAHLQPKLEIARVQSPTCLAEVPEGILVVSRFQRRLSRGCQHEVGAVKHVEAFSPELQTDSL